MFKSTAIVWVLVDVALGLDLWIVPPSGFQGIVTYGRPIYLLCVRRQNMKSYGDDGALQTPITLKAVVWQCTVRAMMARCIQVAKPC